MAPGSLDQSVSRINGEDDPKSGYAKMGACTRASRSCRKACSSLDPGRTFLRSVSLSLLRREYSGPLSCENPLMNFL